MQFIKRLVTVACAVAFLAVAAAPMASAEDKPLSPQQQKMKDCAASWKDEKAKTGAKGRDAYRAFQKDCLKKS
jgi:Ni/Co efflux regulator RcnB